MKFGDFEYEIKYGLAKITSYTGNATKLTIPSKIGKYNVYTIGNRAFFALHNLEKVIVPKSVGKIEDGAFIHCPNLSRVDIFTVEEINSPFACCSSNLVVYTPFQEMAEKLEDLSYNFAIYCKKDFETTVTNEANKECCLNYIKFRSDKIYIPDEINGYKITEINFALADLWDYDELYLEKVRLPRYLKRIPNNFFADVGIESIEMGSNIEEIGNNAFTGCRYLKTLEIPSSVKKIGPLAFFNSSFERLEIPEGVEEIQMNLFSSSDDLEEVILPSSITRIGAFAFARCNKLKEVTIADNVKELECGVFEDCKGLETVKLSNNITHLPENSFAFCRNLKSIELPDNLLTIGGSAFACCEKLESIKIPETVTRIGQVAFGGCQNLKEAYIPKDISTVKGQIFLECDNLKKIYYDGTKIIDWGAECAEIIKK